MAAADIRYQILLNGAPNTDATAAVSSILVTESVREESRFEVVFATDIDSGSFCLKDDARLKPGSDRELGVVATIDGESSVLINGLIIDRDGMIKQGGPGSSFTVRGADRRVAMDRNHARYVRHKGTVSDVVRGILEAGEYGFESEVEDVPVDFAEADHDGRAAQPGSDLQLVTELAGRAGVEFWIDWELQARFAQPPKLIEKAYFKAQPPRNESPIFGSLPVPPLLAPAGAVELKLNAGDKESNALDFQTSRTTEVPRQSGPVKRINFRTGALQSTSTTPSQDPLGEAPPEPSGELARPVVTAGGVSMAHAATTAALNDAQWSVHAAVKTSAYALCGLVRPRQVIKVSGVGDEDDGDYLVWKVTHRIDAADHEMTVELRRNAVGGS